MPTLSKSPGCRKRTLLVNASSTTVCGGPRSAAGAEAGADPAANRGSGDGEAGEEEEEEGEEEEDEDKEEEEEEGEGERSWAPCGISAPSADDASRPEGSPTP